MSFGSLRLRLLLGAGGFILAAVAISAFGLSVLFKDHVERWIDAELRADLDQLIAGIDASPGGTLAVVKPPSDPRFDQPLSGLYWQVAVEPAGPVLRSRSLWDDALALPAEPSIGPTVHHHLVGGPAGQTLYLLQRRVALPARLGGKIVQAAVGLDDSEVRAAVWRFATALVPFLLILATLLTAAAWVQVAFGLRPLASMRVKLASIAAGSERRLGAGFPDEVQPLAQEIDALLAARERQLEKARTQAADLAHGLKTPLQVLAGDAQRLKAQGKGEIAAEIESISAGMQRLVERQLARARMGGADPGAGADVSAAVAQVRRVVERTPEGQRLSWTVEVADGVLARIDAADLTEALGNLIENAARHARSRVGVTATATGGSVVIAVWDDGLGIPPERQAEALRRGTRLDASGPGAGLGLAITSEIAETWDGALFFEKPEHGFRVCLRVPAAPPLKA